jgi:hypothetical protein
MGRVTHLLIHTLTLKRPSPEGDGMGGYTKEPLETIASGLRGRVAQLNEEDRVVAARYEAIVTHRIYCEPDLEVKPNDVFIYGSRTFRVKIPTLKPSVEIYNKSLCEEVQSGS